MSEPLVIYSCPVCALCGHGQRCIRQDHPPNVPVRVFRESDVRPIVASVEGLLVLLDESDQLASDAEFAVIVAARAALRTFPVPADWRAA